MNWPDIYNNSIKGALISEKWVHSYLIPLLKPGKGDMRIKEYWIITMQNCIGKLLEKK